MKVLFIIIKIVLNDIDLVVQFFITIGTLKWQKIASANHDEKYSHLLEQWF